jgi:hypothetical protein
LLAIPPAIIDVVAKGDPATMTESFLVYSWVGGTASLDGEQLSGNRGFESGDVGPHDLLVGNLSVQATITRADSPAGALAADPVFIASGEQTRLDWSTVSGTFLDSVMDWGIETGGDASGTVSLIPPGTRTFALNLVTVEGGAWAAVTVFVDENPPELIFADGFESGDVSAW